MNRSKAVLKNMMWELGYYVIVIVLGFLAPRFIIITYGSEVNGLSSTINQIINIILLLQSGAMTASIFSLYKPISEKDYHEVGCKIASAQKFFRNISLVFAGIVVIVAVVTAFVLDSNIKPLYIFLAFFLMGVKSFIDLLFVSKFRILFTAFQEKYIVSISTLIEQVIYYALVFCSIFLKWHFLFMYVWLLLGCACRVIFLEIVYTKKYRKIIPKCDKEEITKIKGRNYSLVNEVSHSIVGSSITIILSFMYGLTETSVYAVYALVNSGLDYICTALYSAFSPSFGDLVANDNKEAITKTFSVFRYGYVMFSTVLMMCMMFLLVPFVKIYTNGIADANYINYLLALFLSVSAICSAYRIPYNIVVSSYGAFKETWLQPVISAVLSLIISCCFGLIDYPYILVGPIVFYLINFLYQHIRLKKLIPYLYNNKVFVYFIISLIGLAGAFLGSYFLDLSPNILFWLIYAVASLAVAILYVCLMSLIFARTEIKSSLSYFTRFFKRGQANG